MNKLVNKINFFNLVRVACKQNPISFVNYNTFHNLHFTTMAIFNHINLMILFDMVKLENFIQINQDNTADISSDCCDKMMISLFFV